jgi:hypothetical protein
MSTIERTFAVRGTETPEHLARVLARREEYRQRRESFTALARLIHHIDLDTLERTVSLAAKHRAEDMCKDLAVEWGPQAFAESDLTEYQNREQADSRRIVLDLLPARAALVLQAPDSHRLRQRIEELFDDYVDAYDEHVRNRQEDTYDHWMDRR